MSSKSTSMPAKGSYTLKRHTAVPALIGKHEDFLIIAGLSNTTKDVAAVTGDGAHTFGLGTAMGGACMVGLGLALAQPRRQVLVVTGDGEMLMGMGGLATIAIQKPRNLSIVCVDNGHYEETGHQPSHTSQGVHLDKIALGAGIGIVRTVDVEEEIAEAARVIRAGEGPVFVLLRVSPGDGPACKRNMQPASCRTRFRNALLAPAPRQ
jgi:thiamine pyrophosphate-dependent acetolactate synthase large subunit-like protein